MNDFGVDIDPKDINGLFKAFDYENDGTINFNEFIRVVVGPMNAFRTKICGRAFQQIDYNGDGTLSLEDIKGSYNASFHPDVKAGKKTEDQVLTEWLTTFENHYNMITGGQNDGKISPEEFIEYYTHVSANIDNDAYFELMMSNCWNLDNKNNPSQMSYAGSSKKIAFVNSREAYLRDHHRNLFGNDKQAVF
jgi:Ca2+-binding EF-hand superfamily protein